MNILEYSKPTTKEQIMTNIVYLLKENEKMKNFEAFTLGTKLDCSNTDSIPWVFIESILPELNEFFNKKWKELELDKNIQEIKKLELMLEDVIKKDDKF